MDIYCCGLELFPELVTPRTQVIPCDIDRNSSKPSVQAAVAAEALAPFERTQEGVLRDGLREIGITGRTCDKPANSRLVQPDQFVDVNELADDHAPLRYG